MTLKDFINSLKRKINLIKHKKQYRRKERLSSFQFSPRIYDSKVRATLYSIVNSPTRKRWSAAFIWMVTQSLGFNPQTQKLDPPCRA